VLALYRFDPLIDLYHYIVVHGRMHMVANDPSKRRDALFYDAP
jgi:hypothetical protein